MKRSFIFLLVASLYALPLASAEVEGGKRVIRVGQIEASKSEPASDGIPLRLQSVTFDPVTETVDYSGVGLSSVPSSRYGIVQLDSSSTEIRHSLQSRGVELLGYLPDFAFRVRLTEETRRVLESTEGVRWVGPYLPGYKVHSSLWEGSEEIADELVIVLFPSEDPSEAARKLTAAVPGAFPLRMVADSSAPRLIVAITRDERDRLVNAAAMLESVSWVEPSMEITLHNNNALGPVQGNLSGEEGQKIFARGLTGTGQIVAVADSGADVGMCFFRNLNGRNSFTPASDTIAPEMGVLFPDNKVIGYWVQENADAYDDNQVCGSNPPTGFHGTHVAGSAVGDNILTPSAPGVPGIDTGDGMAPNAQLLFQDIGDASGCLHVSDQVGLMFSQALRGGARLHNNSWGGDSNGRYTILDFEADRFLFDNPEMAIFVAAGNAGPGPSTIGAPAVSKNVIAIGALGSGNSTTVAGFSGRGPTEDGRIKPDLLAPGISIISAAGDSNSSNDNCNTRSSNGTSMASPIATGAAALLRQYFADGFYPTGQRATTDRMEPSGMLVKAAMLNGALALPAAGQFGGPAYGWGRVFLNSNLYFDGDQRDLRVFDLPSSQGLRNGESHSYTVNVEGGEELRATLVWFDPEATFGAAKHMVNDLDLTVSRGSDTLRGNVFSTSGESVAGGQRDSVNTVEQVRLPSPSAGTYTVTVRGANVPGTGRSFTDRQGYALVVSSKRCETGVVAAPGALNAATNPVFGIDLSWTPASGSATTQIYRSIAGKDDFRFIGSTSSGFFNDNRAQGGVAYVYRLRGADGCGEGPLSASHTVLATGACDLQPEFSGATRAISNSPDCSITLEWSPATAGCPLGDGIIYNIYRSTEPDSFPDQPIASVSNVTRFDDLTVEAGVLYHYIVRAEDRVAGGTGPNGGNEEDNTTTRSAVVVGPPGDLGTWHDNAGDGGTAALLVGDFPWHVSLAQAESGIRSYHAGITDSDYPANTCASLVTPDLQLGPGAALTYSARFDLEWEWDGVIVEISKDGGSTWVDLPPAGGYPGTLAQTLNPPVNACGYPATQGAFTGPIANGSLSPWTDYQSDLSPFAGESVRIRWRLTTDPGSEFEGFYLDTISITNVALPGDCIPVIVVPEAAFAVETRSPSSGAVVAFRDLSKGNPESFLWNFGDGTTSTVQNPTHVYAAPGLYEVTLTVTNSAGADTTVRTIRIFDAALTYDATMLVAGQARAQGGAGSFFKSAFWMTNLAANETVVRLHYLPAPGSSAGGADQTVLIAIAPGQSVAFNDVLGEALGATENTGGAIVVEVGSGLPVPIVTSRTYNEPSAFSGSFGQYIPAVPLLRSDGLSLQIDGLGGDGASRSNVGVANLTASTITATVIVLDPSGQQIGNAIPVSLPAFSASQINAVNQAAGAGSLPLFSVRVTGTDRFFAYASKLDNTTSDPIFVPDSLQPNAEQWIDGVGATAGGGNTFFRSNLSISNRGTSSADVTIDFLPRGSTSPSATQRVTVSAGETLFFRDSLTEIFSLPGAGMYRIATSEVTPVVAWARTFNDRGELGTLGQFIPGFGRADLLGNNGGILQGLSDNDAYRTNLGLVNVSPNDVGVTVEVYDRDGMKKGEQFHVLAGGQTAFIGRILQVIAGTEIADGYVIVRPGIGDAIYTWASYVDNVSTDQTFVRPLPVP